MPADPISTRARQIHFSNIVIDTHADTPQRFFFDQFDLAHHDADGCVDIPRLRAGGVSAIAFALWVPVDVTGDAATGYSSGEMAKHLWHWDWHGMQGRANTTR